MHFRPENNSCSIVRTRGDSRIRDLRSESALQADCKPNGFINKSPANNNRHSNSRGSKSLGNNVVIVINNSATESSSQVSSNTNHILALGDSISPNCRGAKNSDSGRGNGLSRTRRVMGVLCTDKHPSRGREDCNGTTVASPRPASLPSLPPSPESSNVDDTSPGATTSPSFTITKGSKTNVFRQHQISTGSRKRSVDTAFPESTKEQEHVPRSRRIRVPQRLSSDDSSMSDEIAGDKDEICQERSKDCFLTLALSPEENGGFLIHPSVTVTVFSGVGGASKGLKQLQQLKEFACKDCSYCRERLNVLNSGDESTYDCGISPMRKNGIHLQSPTKATDYPNGTQHQPEPECEQVPQCCYYDKAPQKERCQCELHYLRHHCQNQNSVSPNRPGASPPSTLSVAGQQCAFSTSSSLSELSSPSPSSSHRCQGPCSPGQQASLSALQQTARPSFNRPGDVADNSVISEPASSPSLRCTQSPTFPATAAPHHDSETLSSMTKSSSLPSTDHRQLNLAQENIYSSTGSNTIPLNKCSTNSRRSSAACDSKDDTQPSNESMSLSHPSLSSSPSISLVAYEASVATDGGAQDHGNGAKTGKHVTKEAVVPALSRSLSRHGGTCDSSSVTPCTPSSAVDPCPISSKSAALLQSSSSSSLSPSETSQRTSSSSLSSRCSSHSERHEKNQKLGMTLSSSLPALSRLSSPSPTLSPSSPSTPSAAVASTTTTAAPTTVECKWRGCKSPLNIDPSDLLEHVRQHAEEQIANKAYACLWSDCKVYNKPSWSGSWLERHIVSHSGHRPFKCILDNCGQRFHSQAALERHVNSHFGAGGGGPAGGVNGLGHGGAGGGTGGRVGGRSKEEISQHRMALKRKRQLKRRCMQTGKWSKRSAEFP